MNNLGKSTRKSRKKDNFGAVMIAMVSFIVVALGVTAFAKIDNERKINESLTSGEYATIRFSEMYDITETSKDISKTYKNFDGKKVELTGYMAVQSPLDGSFLYLVNQPYVSCPFCAIGDITKLEIIPVYNADGSKVKYTENGVTIFGTLEVSEKVDSLDYTTQCRIYADRITEITPENVDTELQSYYETLSQGGMIIDIQQLQMTIEYDTKEEYLSSYGNTKIERLNGLANYWVENDIAGYVEYIKECPDIVKSCEPTREDLIEINNGLLSLYDKQINVLEKYASVIYRAQQENLTNEEKEQLYDELLTLNSENLKLYNEYNEWNNKLRE